MHPSLSAVGAALQHEAKLLSESCDCDLPMLLRERDQRLESEGARYFIMYTLYFMLYAVRERDQRGTTYFILYTLYCEREASALGAKGRGTL